MDEIEQRLKETTDSCIKSYEAWRNNIKDETARENLAEATHDLRKVASRIEIEIAVSEREQMANKPIPIPPHRSSRKGPQGGDEMDMDDDIGNNAGNDANDFNGNGGSGGQHRRSGGGGGSGGGRRPQNRGRRPNRGGGND